MVEVSTSRDGLSVTGVSVPLKALGYNSIDSFGKCDNGEKTERSNALAAFSSSVPAPASLPTLAFSSILSPSDNVDNGLSVLDQVLNLESRRCFIGGNGNFTVCFESGLDNATIIVKGAVDPKKQWIRFENASFSTVSSSYNLSTCPVNSSGVIDAKRCFLAYYPPSGYSGDSKYLFDPFAR